MENIESKSLEEVAVEVLRETKEKATYLELFNKVAEIKNFTEEEKEENIARFYTDITASGNFVYVGEDYWDLKENQNLEALDSEFYSEHSEIEGDDEEEKPKRKTRKQTKRVYSEGDENFVDLTYNDLAEQADSDDDYNNEDESYEAADSTYDKNYEDDSDYDDEENDSEYESEDYDDDYDEDEDDDDDYDEDSYNAIMDEWEDSYDK